MAGCILRVADDTLLATDLAGTAQGTVGCMAAGVVLLLVHEPGVAVTAGWLTAI